VWMRLVGFYAMAALHSEARFNLAVPRALETIALRAFGDRLHISTEPSAGAVTYSVRGLRDLLPEALGGRRFAAPYGRAVIKSWNRWTLRDRLNSFLYALADRTGVVYSPPWDSLSAYQGYSETILIPLLRGVALPDFIAQVEADHASISQRIAALPRNCVDAASELSAGTVLVFPTGTGRQFVPIEWARRNLPQAIFAIHARDAERGEWQISGLKTVIYSTPDEIAAVGAVAAVTVTTDSFPSHVLQYSGGNIVVLITGTERSRVVSPGFKGQVVEAVAPCYPCPHLERRGFPKCKAGFKACLNWESPEYTSRILELVGCAERGGG